MDHKHIRILVTEDDEQDLSYLSTILQQEGYLVDGVRNGDQALDRLSREEYQLVLTDLRMPKQDVLHKGSPCKAAS